MSKTVGRTLKQDLARIDFQGFAMFAVLGLAVGSLLIPGILTWGEPGAEIGFIFGIPGILTFICCLIRAVHHWRLSQPDPPPPPDPLDEWKEASRDRRIHQREMLDDWTRQFNRLCADPDSGIYGRILRTSVTGVGEEKEITHFRARSGIVGERHPWT